MGFEEATPIQAKAIPHILEGRDIIAQAPTGTGKTCAFGAPAIDLVDLAKTNVQILILSPTRELTIQIAHELGELSKYKEGLRILPIYGGQSIDRQMMALRKRPQIVIGTPGRVMDHMRRGTLKLDGLHTLILDEADEMLNMGFREDIDVILESVPDQRQFVLFSATLPKAILDIARRYQNDPIKVNVIHKVMTVPTIEQCYLEARDSHKLEILSRLIDANNFRLSVVFCNTKKRVDDVCKGLQERGYAAEALHGDMKQLHRDSVMNKFRNGHVEMLVATDVAARGIDVDEVDAVFNYDIPTDEEYYVHRIGRTGRANRKGVSYSFVTGREIGKLKDIQRYTKSKIKLIKPPTIEAIKDNKISSIIDQVRNVMTETDLTQYTTMIENMINESEMDITTVDVAAAFLKIAMDKVVMGSSENVKVEDFEDRRSRFTTSSTDDVRLFINLGKKDKLRKSDLVTIVQDYTSLKGKQINRVDVLEKFSFFEIPGSYVEEVMENLASQKVRGRKINIEVANRKKR
ncbi:MAG: DEAD/DEAH box helicase [Cellulosilyticaceae bacterium]